VTTRDFQERLARRARKAGLSLEPAVAARFEIYFRLLATWNQRINLTGLDLSETSPEALDRLLLEPLAAARHIPPGARRLIDIGSGGGSPALPLAVALPRLHVLMVESKVRKSAFLREAVRALEPVSAEVAVSRYEELLARPSLHETHDALTLRAVRVEGRVLRSLQAFVRPGGQLLLFRGAAGPDPREAITPPLFWIATVPLLESLQSRLVIIEKR
jgi:16S rRNA (guanine527-N7)-methyltransferase